jgi:hypothetical protein
MLLDDPASSQSPKLLRPLVLRRREPESEPLALAALRSLRSCSTYNWLLARDLPRVRGAFSFSSESTFLGGVLGLVSSAIFEMEPVRRSQSDAGRGSWLVGMSTTRFSSGVASRETQKKGEVMGCGRTKEERKYRERNESERRSYGVRTKDERSNRKREEDERK